MDKDTKIKRKHYSPIDLAFLILAPATAAILTLLLPLNLLVSTLLYFGPPALYISWRRKDIIGRSLIYATTIAVISILTDYLAERDLSWVSTSMFDFRLVGVVPIEAIVWMLLFTYFIVVYYLYFYDSAPHNPIGKRMPFVFFAAFAVLVWVGLMAVVDLRFTIDYYYIKFGLVLLLLPLLAFAISFPQYLRIFLKITPYFIVFGLVNLLVSLHKGHWSYPGQHFVGWVQLGAYRFPIEELVFWIILYPSFLISQFELFNNDQFKFKPRKATQRD